MKRLLALCVLLPLPVVAQAAGEGQGRFTSMVTIPAGTFVPQYGGEETRVEAFELDVLPVTVEEYAAFVEARPEWQRSTVKRIFADAGYLSSWASDTEPGPGHKAGRPATGVSWFGARAYCEEQGKRLPSVAEWEFAGLASRTQANAFRDSDFNREVLSLYTAREVDDLPAVGSTYRNYYGVWDLHGVVWEWVEDFNSVLLSGAGRADTALDRGLFCASGSVGASDIGNYAAFLRYSFRASVNAAYSGRLMGFRCARSFSEQTQ